ncbi:hypothetical protein K493DRAFT_297839 [Basidiobolus meristosporus CBS 931.73]|uniref:Uncharacterized protein n=1 Tax=Basidiobolus meristosporus CBS 931.73 TaxID=1314790 RepID=A0A1Y1YX85_9FUNG|nr:hypothetical protein K493DRAFT_297839 [Basidiobolus meristosporus CBS 931.73]|eukprot:ORY02631.1 hypothetical protein K493DRAFT_297839 [Basidiobolus meristosporus CBS 931.73]
MLNAPILLAVSHKALQLCQRGGLPLQSAISTDHSYHYDFSYSGIYCNPAGTCLGTVEVVKAESAYILCLELRKGLGSTELEILEKLVPANVLDKIGLVGTSARRLGKVQSRSGSKDVMVGLQELLVFE